jgi:hypothetical protein
LDASQVLVSYTSDVEPWDGVDTLMIDSGGYSLVDTDRTEYQTSDKEYLNYVQKQMQPLSPTERMYITVE